MKDEMAALREKRRALDGQAAAFRTGKGPELAALLEICIDRRARYEALQAAATTKHGFIIWGWTPSKDFEALKDNLKTASGGMALVRAVRAGPGETAPVRLENHSAVRQFEPLLRLFPLPRYGSIDPTIYLATVFPSIFGLMLADLGYGLILALGSAIGFARFSKGSMGRTISFIAATCAFFTLVFGAVFGEFFGEFGKRAFGLSPLWRERFSFTGEDKTATLLGYMALTLSIGVAHVVLALVLGFINSRRVGDRGKAVDSLAKIAGIFLMLFAVGRLTSVLPPVFTTLGVAALVAFVALMLSQVLHNPAHVFLLPLETLGTIGNILSYVRIMAVGLVSVVLAFLANLFGEMIENVVLAAIVSLLVHALNLALGIIDPTIQGLRLHYVEFSPKFFLGGGSPYSPFRKTGGRT